RAQEKALMGVPSGRLRGGRKGSGTAPPRGLLAGRRFRAQRGLPHIANPLRRFEINMGKYRLLTVERDDLESDTRASFAHLLSKKPPADCPRWFTARVINVVF